MENIQKFNLISSYKSFFIALCIHNQDKNNYNRLDVVQCVFKHMLVRVFNPGILLLEEIEFLYMCFVQMCISPCLSNLNSFHLLSQRAFISTKYGSIYIYIFVYVFICCFLVYNKLICFRIGLAYKNTLL